VHHALFTNAFNAFFKGTLGRKARPKYGPYLFWQLREKGTKSSPLSSPDVQIFDFNRIQVKDIANHLEENSQKEQVNYEEEALRLIAKQSRMGALRDALSIFDLIVTYSAVRK